MLTDAQRQQILAFCQEHQIIRFWMMDAPLLNAAVGAGRPSVIVTFRPYCVAVPQKFARMERALTAITGPETALYSTDGLSPRLTDKILKQASPVFPDPAAPPVSREAVAKFCRKHNIAKLRFCDAPLPASPEKEFAPSVIVDFQPGHGYDYFDFCGIEEEAQKLFGLSATLYAENMVSPMLDADALDSIAEVWYDHLA